METVVLTKEQFASLEEWRKERDMVSVTMHTEELKAFKRHLKDDPPEHGVKKRKVDDDAIFTLSHRVARVTKYRRAHVNLISNKKVYKFKIKNDLYEYDRVSHFMVDSGLAPPFPRRAVARQILKVAPHKRLPEYRGCKTVEDVMGVFTRAATKGTLIHEEIADVIKQNKWSYVEGRGVYWKTRGIAAEMRQFIQWVRQVRGSSSLVMSEVTLHAHDIALAGTPDLILEDKHTGELQIVDFKTCRMSDLKEGTPKRKKFATQLALYEELLQMSNALSSTDDAQVTRRSILQLHPSNPVAFDEWGEFNLFDTTDEEIDASRLKRVLAEREFEDEDSE